MFVDWAKSTTTTLLACSLLSKKFPHWVTKCETPFMRLSSSLWSLSSNCALVGWVPTLTTTLSVFPPIYGFNEPFQTTRVVVYPCSLFYHVFSLFSLMPDLFPYLHGPDSSSQWPLWCPKWILIQTTDWQWQMTVP